MTITQLLEGARYKFTESGNQAIFNVLSALAATTLTAYDGTIGDIDFGSGGDTDVEVTVPPTVLTGQPHRESHVTGVDTEKPPTQMAGQP